MQYPLYTMPADNADATIDVSPFAIARQLGELSAAAIVGTSAAGATEDVAAMLREDDGTAKRGQLTPTHGRMRLQQMRPQVSSSLDLARAQGMAAAGGREPSRFPGEPPLYVGSGAHAADLALLRRLEVRAVRRLSRLEPPWPPVGCGGLATPAGACAHGRPSESGCRSSTSRRP